ncbi:hypothetical protein [Streptomyces sp. SID10815]|uniref:type II toxin-antitoxin system RelE family toxin n=1 Tax=Streptomyces sp. SID10815 TaxID=2706027 RepID=UPI0013CD24A3|nr:hypothetical protein [Streptomyces sp. SID10815]NEA52381.1 hypothetical protein [Streptomyces sp. SID10815]
MYKLRYSPPVEAVWDSLPDQARDEFTRAIAAACDDPWKHTKPRGEDPRDVRRILHLQHTVAGLLIMEAATFGRIYVDSLDYLS